MDEMMTFPATVEEFMKQYRVVDTEGIYASKGMELVPIFRMQQWFDHQGDTIPTEWIRQQICEYPGMESAMWSKLLRLWRQR